MVRWGMNEMNLKGSERVRRLSDGRRDRNITSGDWE